MELSKIKVDLDKVDNGEWIADLPDSEGLRVKVRGITSLAYQKAMMQRRNAVPRSERLPDGDLPAEVDFRIVGEAYADAVLLDWDGLTSDGKPVPYSKEMARELMTDRAYLRFRAVVMWAALRVGENRAVVTETIMGNSESFSNGTDPTGT